MEEELIEKSPMAGLRSSTIPEEPVVVLDNGAHQPAAHRSGIWGEKNWFKYTDWSGLLEHLDDSLS